MQLALNPTRGRRNRSYPKKLGNRNGQVIEKFTAASETAILSSRLSGNGLILPFCRNYLGTQSKDGLVHNSRHPSDSEQYLRADGFLRNDAPILGFLRSIGRWAQPFTSDGTAWYCLWNAEFLGLARFAVKKRSLTHKNVARNISDPRPPLPPLFGPDDDMAQADATFAHNSDILPSVRGRGNLSLWPVYIHKLVKYSLTC
jgi:hypothetical protein